MAPAGSVNREEGSDENVAISERNNVDSDLPKELSTQKAAVPWAAIALPEIRFATQSLLKAVFRKAVQVDVLAIAGHFRISENFNPKRHKNRLSRVSNAQREMRFWGSIQH
jgi:hypothetical protein